MNLYLNSSYPHTINNTENPKIKVAMLANLSTNFKYKQNISPLILKDKAIESTQSQTQTPTELSNVNYNFLFTNENFYNPTGIDKKKYDYRGKEESFYTKNIQTVYKIFYSYLNALNHNWEEKYKKLYNKYLKEKERHKKEKSFLIKSNSALKGMILEIIDNIKKYYNDFNKDKNKAEEITKQLLKENEYLRKVLINTLPNLGFKSMDLNLNERFSESINDLQLSGSIHTLKTYRKKTAENDIDNDKYTSERMHHLKEKSFEFKPSIEKEETKNSYQNKGNNVKESRVVNNRYSENNVSNKEKDLLSSIVPLTLNFTK